MALVVQAVNDYIVIIYKQTGTGRFSSITRVATALTKDKSDRPKFCDFPCFHPIGDSPS